MGVYGPLILISYVSFSYDFVNKIKFTSEISSFNYLNGLLGYHIFEFKHIEF